MQKEPTAGGRALSICLGGVVSRNDRRVIWITFRFLEINGPKLRPCKHISYIPNKQLKKIVVFYKICTKHCSPKDLI